jgi:hypothetical protein
MIDNKVSNVKYCPGIVGIIEKFHKTIWLHDMFLSEVKYFNNHL